MSVSMPLPSVSGSVIAVTGVASVTGNSNANVIAVVINGTVSDYPECQAFRGVGWGGGGGGEEEGEKRKEKLPLPHSSLSSPKASISDTVSKGQRCLQNFVMLICHAVMFVSGL